MEKKLIPIWWASVLNAIAREYSAENGVLFTFTESVVDSKKFRVRLNEINTGNVNDSALNFSDDDYLQWVQEWSTTEFMVDYLNYVIISGSSDKKFPILDKVAETLDLLRKYSPYKDNISWGQEPAFMSYMGFLNEFERTTGYKTNDWVKQTYMDPVIKQLARSNLSWETITGYYNPMTRRMFCVVDEDFNVISSTEPYETFGPLTL